VRLPFQGASSPRLTTAFAPRAGATRWLAHDERRAIDCLVYLFDVPPGEARGGLWRYLETNVGTRRSHTLPLEAAGRERGGRIWASAPYPGNHTTLVTLESLRVSKGGAFGVYEMGRAVEQLLEAVSASHRAGLVHGPIDGDGVLVSPRGTLLIELYGLDRALGDRPGPADHLRREEIRSVAELAWRLLTGAEASEREVFERQAARSQHREWIRWIGRALDPAVGFADADEAIDRLPSRGGVEVRVPAGRARGWLGRLSSAVAPRRDAETARSRKKDGGDGV